jgi:two-component system chemotaxis sensor kinase CheA
MDINKLKDIFIEEANEIIEKLDVDIINFEDDPEDKELLNELFRGVHTLKGSANSFGFSRLGEFVHHFEDALDFYRSSDEDITSHIIDVFLEAVDVIKEVLELEIEGSSELPTQYTKCLEDIKVLLSKKEVEDKPVEVEINLADEFSQDNNSDVDIEKFKTELIEGETLYKITLNLDDDVYFRGFDHSKLFKLLAKEGQILESFWDMSQVPSIEDLNPETSYIKSVQVYVASKNPEDSLKEIFDYLDEEEYVFEKLYTSTKEAPKTIDKEEIKFGRREEDKKASVAKKGRRKSDATSYVKIDTNKLDELFDSIGELVIAQNFLSENKDIQVLKNENITKTINILSKTTKLIQNRVMSLRMVPIHDTFEKMKRVVRDASKKVNKEISLVVEGAETEIDKTMIDSLSDPLIHIIRNSIDHGIEDCGEDREKQRKSPIGKVTLRAYHKGGKIAIEISDDGRGINREKVLSKAIEKGLVSADEDLSDSQVFGLIMQAGFSTADVISDISGRGVGLDVVRTSIEKLKGKVEISSSKGKGSTFTILLPLTLAIIDGMLVESENETYIIPTLSVIESFIPQKDIVHSFKDQGEFVDLRGEMIPIIRLNEILETGTNKPDIWESTLVCLENENGKFAVLVDDLIGRQQVVIKPLGQALSNIKEFSGSAVMGSGEIALILNIEELWGQAEISS